MVVYKFASVIKMFSNLGNVLFKSYIEKLKAEKELAIIKMKNDILLQHLHVCINYII